MLGSSFEKMSDGMKWFIVLPTSLLLLSVSWFVFSFTTNIKSVSFEPGKGKITFNTSAIDDALTKTQKLSDYLDQQQKGLVFQQNKVNEKLNLAKTDPKKFLNNDINTAIAGLNKATTGIKNQSAQLTEQQNNLKALQEELMQLKQTAKQNRSK